MALFSPIKGTTSQTVPNETKSKKSSKFGSLIFLLLDLNPFESFKIFFISPISNSYGLSELLVKATPLAIIALGLSYCFKNNIYKKSFFY